MNYIAGVFSFSVGEGYSGTDQLRENHLLMFASDAPIYLSSISGLRNVIN